jgi:ribosomal-protein-alanine N-acetyltransferase
MPGEHSSSFRFENYFTRRQMICHARRNGPPRDRDFMDETPTDIGLTSSGLSLRPMKPDDTDAVLVIEGRCHSHPWTAEHFAGELANPHSRLVVLRCEGQPAAFLCYWLLGDELSILNVAVDPAFRRRGLASALMRHALDEGAAAGTQQALLEVRRGNSGAIALYRRFGFRMVGERRRYYADGEDALVMVRAGENSDDPPEKSASPAQ